MNIENIISEISKQHDNMIKEAFEKCGFDTEYALNNPTAFFCYHTDLPLGFRDTYYLGDPTKGNALALFEIEQIADFDEIIVRCNILKNKKVVH